MLLPAVERRGEIHFYLAKSLSYGARLTAAFVLMAAGVAIQLAASGVNAALFTAAGCGVMLAGVILLLVKGYENKVRTVPGTAEWRPARRTEINRILAISKKQRKWDEDFFDITSGRGVLALIAVTILAVAVAAFAMKFSERHGRLILLDSAVLLLPFWLTGVRSILKNDRLVVKIDTLLAAEKAHGKAASVAGEQFVWQLQVAKAAGGAGDVPHDVKAMLQFENAPPSFLGLQMQVSINSVNGSDYPYFYCILVAKPEHGLLKKPIPSPPANITIEPKRQGEVDVVVVRQTTTRNSGYETNAKATANIFRFSLEQARRVTQP
ncbi:MAG TPA: hypothetical protein VMZ06_00380 [Candidatus Bathyarchaeia archaeon]|nr:hypothetical protein [Candidatus Bathyarchaeia archaeon]